jgi:hypothetical protein
MESVGVTRLLPLFERRAYSQIAGSGDTSDAQPPLDHHHRRALSNASYFLNQQANGATQDVAADRVRTEFLQRLRRVADSGNLFEQKSVASMLNLKFEASTIDRNPAISCPAPFRATTVTVRGASWFHPLSTGSGHLDVPAFTINPANVTGDPQFTYQILHYSFCSEWPRLHDGMEATVTFNGLPAFNCLTPSNIRSTIPEGEFVMATDGVSLIQYKGRIDDDSATTLTFNFRAGVQCALAADITQDQEKGLRYRRAQYKYETCRQVTDREFCAIHPDVGWGDTQMLGDMERAAIKRCGSINSIYVAEPANQIAPPLLPHRIKRSPCDDQ